MRKLIAGMFWLVVFTLVNVTTIYSQDERLSSPQKSIESLFKAMYEGDGILAKSVFTEDAVLQTVHVNKEGKITAKTGELEQFVTAIGTPHEKVWDERVTNLKINIDADLAQAWMDYSFYVGDEFSHCGVNAMHLIRSDGEWRIVHIIDTRRNSDCN
ncbi:MAG: nuclear transport factor 2 family protein [Saprospiraceae bacterium]|nr:nuclear transport factor 2 family protein [Saprospiraceae bacterium]